MRALLFLWALVIVSPQPAHLDLDDNTVTLGRSHACALERVDELSVGGEIVCWGDNSFGQLDPPSGLYVQLSASEHTTCAISIEEKVACWGGEESVVGPTSLAASLASSGEEFGDPIPVTTTAASGPRRGKGRDIHTKSSVARRQGDLHVHHHHSAASIASLAKGTFVQVSVGARSACAVGSSDGGSLVCWGDDSHGQVSAFPKNSVWVQVSCGGDTCCGLSSHLGDEFEEEEEEEEEGGGRGGGTEGALRGYPVLCWGSDWGGATGSAVSRRALVNSASTGGRRLGGRLPTLLQVSLGEDGHGCGITGEYRLVCWGSFVGGVEGGLTFWNGTFVQVAASEGLTCAIRGDGTLFCVGEARRLWTGKPLKGSPHLAGSSFPPTPPRDTQFSEISAQFVRPPAQHPTPYLTHYQADAQPQPPATPKSFFLLMHTHTAHIHTPFAVV